MEDCSFIMDKLVFVMTNTLLALTFILVLVTSNTTAQQNYSGNSILTCSNNDTGGPSPAFLYTCNGATKSCPAFLLFKSQPPHTSAATIANLTASNPAELVRINNATAFPIDKEVIVPVNCSCGTSREYYRAEATYVLPQNPTYFTVANNTYQGLTTCDSLRHANPYGVPDLHPGMVLHVPLRCACPSETQIRNETKYLLTYSVTWLDNITNIAARFNVSSASLVYANGFESENQLIFPFTTLLIPLSIEPNSSITRIRNEQPSVTPTVSVTEEKGKTNKRQGLIIGVVSCGVFILVLLFVVSLVLLARSERFFRRGTKGKKTKQVDSADIREEIASIENLSRVYKFRELKEATENFSDRNRIKGSVYRAEFGQGKDILAVKRMGSDASKEVKLLGKINHFNLIKLQGYCKNEGMFYLVFEYMENGSLREWLGESKSTEHHRSWEKRIEIALDVANGLQYLHNFTEPCYVHKDIRTDNILLNGDLRAKVANLTLAQESDKELGSCSSTLHVAGTKGYMAPEYLREGRFTSKMDVYAFGVVLLELITGKDSVLVQDGRETMLSSIMVNLIDRDDAEEKLGLFIDPRLAGNSGRVFALQLVKLSVACLIEEPAGRPDMAEVVSSLLKIYTEMNRILPSINDSAGLGR